ncbi:glucuronate isomerase [Oceanirhabdus seepicola]|uniref:Uronate isomerase n=1 Tax=Oceanirhabdus seepicola TaxID=2828781 RepID=A0A9J6NYV5_9CLOT|nr:glucuronate isomerase [Oceanirhabdus seepicola]MCM1989158.1 glucuronate isomerase [Oceanirhabdus seepicola]
MKKFMDDNFLLNNNAAIELYHNHARKMPIYDYHCHLSSKEIAENKSYKNITELWLGGDHYKWRAMRSNGIEEKFITGNANDYDKFKAWAKTMPCCIGNPLYQWSHLELKRYFNIDELLSENTADVIWNRCNEMLNSEEFTARELIKKSNVEVICTTDDPIDSLEYHKIIRNDESFDVKVLPTFRPDKAINICNDGFSDWINKLSQVSGIKIESYEDFLNALENRINYFNIEGCRISDHSLECVFYEEATEEEIEDIFIKAISNGTLTKLEENKFKTRTFIFLGKVYSTLGWAMQIHIGALRNNNTRMFNLLGPDSGFDSIGDYSVAYPLSKLLNSMDMENNLPKTILYCLNPRDNEVIGTMIGNFQGGGIPGKIQFGSGWWFNDQKDGMIRQMTALSNLGLLSRFVGMVTDSRSFISYTRHEYFRRVLCNFVGEWVEKGEVPYDMELLGGMIEDICYNNSKKYFGIGL